MRRLIRWVYKLLGIYQQIHIMNVQYEVLRHNVKIKHIPKSGELIIFEENGDYYLVTSVIHKIDFRHQIWVVTQQLTEKSGELPKKD